jgi:predicted DNA-binding transcriptional regulator AlpA
MRWIVSPNPKERVFYLHIEKSCIYKKVRKGTHPQEVQGEINA